MYFLKNTIEVWGKCRQRCGLNRKLWNIKEYLDRNIYFFFSSSRLDHMYVYMCIYVVLNTVQFNHTSFPKFFFQCSLLSLGSIIKNNSYNVLLSQLLDQLPTKFTQSICFSKSAIEKLVFLKEKITQLVTLQNFDCKLQNRYCLGVLPHSSGDF